MLSLPLVKYVLVAALRDKLMLSLVIVLVVGASLATFMGSSAIIEKDQFTVIFAAAGLRMVTIFGLVLFVIFFIRRAFESKEIEYLLSRPVSRLSIIFSFAFSFFLLSIFLGIGVGGAVYAVSPHLFGFGHVVWVVSIMIEAIIMVNTALFFSMYISSASSSAMVTLGVYVLGRLMGQFLGIVDSELVDGTGLYSMALQLVSVITPRLDLLGQSSWLIYGFDDHMALLQAILQGVVFSALVISAACLDFVRRQF